jgi:hypothetical protein
MSAIAEAFNTADEHGGKYLSTPHLPFSPGKHEDDTLLSADAAASGRLFNEEVAITEKLDGGNCCIARGVVYARSHKHPATHPWFGTLKSMHHVLAATLDDDTLEIFGENITTVHSIEYSALTSYFYVFGVRRLGQWLAWAEVKLAADALGLPTVPVRFQGRLRAMPALETLILSGMAVPSACGTQRPEGFVVRVAGAFATSEFAHCVAKYVRPEHVQTGDDFTRIWPKTKRTWLKATLHKSYAAA